MLEMKKRNLIFLLIAALLAGCLGTGGILYALTPDQGEAKQITKEQYEEYQYYKTTYSKVDQLKKFISQNFYQKVDEQDLINGMYRGVFAGTGDIYSGYYTKEEYESMMASTIGEYSGVGVTISPDEQGYIVVVAPTDGAPAIKAGIKSGDRILKVDGKEYNRESMDMAASAMRGKAGTTVEITVWKKATGEEVTLTLRREKIVNVTVSSKMLEDNIGYIRVSAFEKNTAQEFETELHDMEVKGVKGVIIDLRGNGGGLVDASVKMADRLLPEGTITYTEDQKGERTYYKSKAGNTELPYVILVDGGSASASEILASAVKDNGGGILVGSKTFGKGIIQLVEQLEDGSGIKLTITQYFSPKGDAIHKIGIEPDFTVDLTEADFDEEGNLIDDRQLKKAEELLRGAQE